MVRFGRALALRVGIVAARAGRGPWMSVVRRGVSVPVGVVSAAAACRLVLRGVSGARRVARP